MVKSVFLEITRACNLRCIFCSNESYLSLSSELSTENFINLVDELNKLGVEDIRLYGGEPFLRADVFEIISQARSHNIAVSIYSNGTILDEDILCSLLKYRIHKMCLSVDSATKETHDYIRGKLGSFITVVNNIKTLIKYGITVDVSLTICHININDIISTYYLLHSLGVNNVKANFVSNVGKAKDVWNDIFLSVTEMRRCYSEVHEIHQQLFKKVPVRKRCQAGTEELFIAANGDVYPCALFITPEYLAGNILTKNIGDIWTKPEGLLATIQEIVSQKQYCTGCGKIEVCGGGCRARAATIYDGNLKSPDTVSCIFHKEILQ